MAEKTEEAGTFNDPVGTVIGKHGVYATVTSPQDFEGHSGCMAATEAHVCGPGEVTEHELDVKGSTGVQLAAVLEHADMTTKQLYKHGDAWCVELC